MSLSSRHPGEGRCACDWRPRPAGDCRRGAYRNPQSSQLLAYCSRILTLLLSRCDGGVRPTSSITRGGRAPSAAPPIPAVARPPAGSWASLDIALHRSDMDGMVGLAAGEQPDSGPHYLPVCAQQFWHLLVFRRWIAKVVFWPFCAFCGALCDVPPDGRLLR